MRYGWHTRSAYAREASELLPFNSQLPAAIFNNITAYLKTYWSDWSQTPLPFAILILSIILIGSLRASKCSFTWIGSILLLTMLVAPGASLLMATPPASLPRTLVFIGPLLSSLSLLMMKSLTTLKLNSKAWMIMGLIPIGFVAWFCILVTFSYAQAAQAQQEFEAGKISRLLDQINRLNPPLKWKKIHGVSYSGGIQRAPLVQNTVRKFPVIDRLVFRLIADNNDIGLAIMNRYGLPPLTLVTPAAEDVNTISCVTNENSSICSSEYIVRLKDGVLRIRFL